VDRVVEEGDEMFEEILRSIRGGDGASEIGLRWADKKIEESTAEVLFAAGPVRFEMVPIQWLKQGKGKHVASSELLSSVKYDGLIRPIVVNPDYQVIEGRKRFDAVKRLGFEGVPVVVIPAQAAYRTCRNLEETKIPLSPPDKLKIYLEDRIALPARQCSELSGMKLVIGCTLMKMLAKAGKGVGTYRLARRLTRLCGDTTDKSVRKCLRWLLKHGDEKRVRQALSRQVNPMTILQCIEKDRDLPYLLDS
jgi:hypothetical protein